MTTSTRNVKPVQVRWKMSKGLQPGDKLPKRKSRLKSYPKLTKAQQLLVEEHIWIAGRLAHSAKSLTGGATGCYTKEDLESVALMALCVAATRYDPDLGWKFSTFAWGTARGWIQHALRDHSRMVRVPRWIAGVRQEVRDMVMRGCTNEEISEELGLDEKQIVMCEESWLDVHYSYDYTPDETRGREFIYEIDEVRAHLGEDIMKQVGDLDDKDIRNLLLHVEGELESEEERKEAERVIAEIRKAITG